MNGAPKILDWKASWNLLMSGDMSLSRIGDGEFMIASGSSDVVFQKRDAELADGICRALAEPNERCLVGVNRAIFYDGPSVTPSASRYWRAIRQSDGGRIAAMCALPQYVDAAMTIPRKQNSLTPEAEWIPFWRRIREWFGQMRILLVSGRSDANLAFWRGFRDLDYIEAPSVDAWLHRDGLVREIRSRGRGRTVVMQIGPAATVLAWRLSREMRCFDLGHLSAEFAHWASGKTPVEGWKEFFSR